MRKNEDMALKVMCVGTLIIDIINAALERLLQPNEGVCTTIELELGGNAFNVAVDVVKLGVPPESVMCVGTVGDDYLGTWFLTELERYGVVPKTPRIQGKRTAKNLILQVKGEERRYHYDEGAAGCLEAEYVIDLLNTSPPEIFYIGEPGSLGSLYAQLPRILSTAKRRKCVTVVDMVIPPHENWKPVYEAAPFIDVFHCNNYEARSFTGCAAVPDMLKKLVEFGITLPVVSQGAGKLMCHYSGTSYGIPSFAVEHVDSTGAGDVFTAGLIEKLLELEGGELHAKLGTTDTDLIEALLFGAAAGAVCVTALGCTPAISQNAVEHLLVAQSEAIVSRITQYAGF